MTKRNGAGRGGTNRNVELLLQRKEAKGPDYHYRKFDRRKKKADPRPIRQVRRRWSISRHSKTFEGVVVGSNTRRRASRRKG